MSSIPPPWWHERHEHEGKHYHAARFDEDTWVVKRLNEDGTESEASVKTQTTEPLEAIKAAVTQDSWS